MKNKYLFGIIALLFFGGILIYAFSSSSSTYENDFQKAALKNKKVKIIGRLDKSENVQIDKKENKFSFILVDKKGNKAKVICLGMPPNNFEHSTTVVATGKFENKIFFATQILTKCPSKYEAEIN
jgi:cytochrome c-type biogenesis protein CcmE